MSYVETYGVIVLYAFIAALSMFLLYRWHTNPDYKAFTLLDLVAENGRISSRKFMEFGAWIVASAAVVIAVVRGQMSNEMLAIYLASFVAARSIGQYINARSDVDIRKASIMKGGPMQTERRAEARSERNPESMPTVEDDLARIEQERATVKAQGR